MNGDALNDLDAKTLQCGDVPGVVGEEADLADAEVRDDLAAEANLTEDALIGSAEGLRFRAASSAVDAELGGVSGAVDGETALGVVEIDECSDAGGCDLAEGRVDGGAAITGSRAKDISGEAMGVDADEDGRVRPGGGGEIAEGEGYVGFIARTEVGDRLDVALVGEHPEVAVLRWENAFGNSMDVALVCHAVANEVGYGDHLEGVQLAELHEIGNAGHGAIFVHDLADDTGGDESGHAGEVDGGFGLAGADEDSTFARAERKDMSGAREIMGT